VSTAQQILYGELPEAAEAPVIDRLPDNTDSVVQMGHLVKDGCQQPLGKMLFRPDAEGRKRMIIPWKLIEPEQYTEYLCLGVVLIESDHLHETVQMVEASSLPFPPEIHFNHFNDDLLYGLANSRFAATVTHQVGFLGSQRLYHVKLHKRLGTRYFV